METGEFQAPYDRTTTIVSVVVGVSMLLLAAFIQNISLAGLSVLLVAGAYAYSARGYAVTEGSIVVRRLAGSVRIPLAEVRSARRAEAADFSGCIRLWGSGGLFGYYGLFRTSRLGRCTWYVTDRGKAVVVRTDAKTVLLSPDDVDGFLAAVGVVATDSADSLSGEATARGAFKARLAVGAVACVIGIAGVSAAVMVAQYSPGAPSFTLRADALEIHDRFYPVTVSASSVDVAAVRVVDLSEETGWRPAARTRGFSNAHYRSGFFRAKNGRSVRLYWANGTKVVLLPAKGEGTAVLMEVADPEGFVRQVRGEWAGSR